MFRCAFHKNGPQARYYNSKKCLLVPSYNYRLENNYIPPVNFQIKVLTFSTIHIKKNVAHSYHTLERNLK